MTPRPHTIFVVDDSRITRAVLRELLEAHGYRVEEAGSGVEARVKIGQVAPDAVLLDWELPDETGPELIKRWAADAELKWIPVLMFTSHKEPERIEYALDAGAVDFVGKPPAPGELEARLRAALRVKALHDELRRLALCDPLTGLYNRRVLHERLRDEFERATRYGNELSVAMADIDFFKRINDGHGHDVGDEVLRQAAELFRSGLRAVDTVARFGGEEFVFILPQVPLAGAVRAMERLRQTGAERPWGTTEHPLKVTFSVGVCALSSCPVARPEELLKAADERLYAAKEGGRDRVVAELPAGRA